MHTLSSRLVISLLNLLLLFITTRLMGAENKGEISLLILNLSVAAIVSGLFGGPSLVYLVPRHSMKSLLVLNYSWSILSAGFLVALSATGLIPSLIGNMSLYVLALTESLVATNTMLLLGREKVGAHNFVQVIKIFVTTSLLIYFYFTGAGLDFELFVLSYQCGLITALLFSAVRLFSSGHAIPVAISHMSSTLREALKFGGLVQIGSLSQLLNYRLSFYFLELLILPAEQALIKIGIYSAALQVAEALWQFARSVSTVQYARVSNLSDPKQGLAISLFLAKLNYSVTFLGVAGLLIVPKSAYIWLFGSEFASLKEHVYYLAPGIIALSIGNAFSHYLAGIGQHRINTQSSVMGLVLTVLLGYYCIKYFDTLGAAAVASAVYIIQTYYQYIQLKSNHGVRFSDLLVNKKDVLAVKDVFRRFLIH